MTAVRFFTSAALRPQEEVDGETVRWLPAWCVVEYEDGRPLVGTWQSKADTRRICWYRTADRRSDSHALHAERFGDEPYWVVTLRPAGDRRFDVEERDIDGAVGARRVWTFDRDEMPALEEEFDATGVLRCRRRYQCIAWGAVIGVEEQRAPAFQTVDLGRPAVFPIPELAGEPYPCGGRVGSARIVEVLSQNVCQGRYAVVAKVDGVWRRGVATLAVMRGGMATAARRIVDLSDPMLAVELGRGQLEHPRQQGRAFEGVVEAYPDGESLETIVARARVTPAAAVSLAVQIADVLRRVAPVGKALGAIRPELVYARSAGDALSLTGIMHRGPAVAESVYAGEAVLVPPLFPTDFASSDDVAGLAQLVWHMVTGRHPWYAADDVRWQIAWDDFHEQRRQRQAWTGPATLAGPLEEAIFAEKRPGLDRFVADLQAAIGTA
jgi:hypothetical protein